MFELASHFRLHLAAVLGVLFVVWLIRRRWRLAVICGLSAGVNAFLVLSLLWPPAKVVSEDGMRLRLATINVHSANQRSDLVLEFLGSADVDVILLMEVNERWMSALESLHSAYPYYLAEPRDDDFGMALFSRRPLTNATVIELGGAELPSIEAEVVADNRRIHLLGTHPLPPGSAAYARLRNEQYRQIAAHVQNRSHPTVVFGDLNATPWSPYFADLLRDGGLQDSSQGLGLFGSWPAWLPFGRIPLDHCLVSPSIQVVGKRLGPSIGSDHLPLVVDLQMPEGDNNASQP